VSIKERLVRGLFAVLFMTAFCNTNAATVFAPLDGNVNFLFGDLQGGTLALFDDSDQSYAGSSLNIPVPSVIGITGLFNGSGDYIASNELTQTLVLTGSNQFILGLFSGGQWLADSNVIAQGANSYSVFFGNGGSALQVDVRIVQTAVPLPAAAWLFGSGLLGLAGIARRVRI